MYLVEIPSIDQVLAFQWAPEKNFQNATRLRHLSVLTKALCRSRSQRLVYNWKFKLQGDQKLLGLFSRKNFSLIFWMRNFLFCWQKLSHFQRDWWKDNVNKTHPPLVTTTSFKNSKNWKNFAFKKSKRNFFREKKSHQFLVAP